MGRAIIQGVVVTLIVGIVAGAIEAGAKALSEKYKAKEAPNV